MLLPAMCNFTTHVRVCTFCKSKETILISETICVDAKIIGVFGKCGTTASTVNETALKCWKCRDDVDEIASLPETIRRHGQ